MTEALASGICPLLSARGEFCFDIQRFFAIAIVDGSAGVEKETTGMSLPLI